MRVWSFGFRVSDTEELLGESAMKQGRSDPVITGSGKCDTASRRALAMIPPDLWPSTLVPSGIVAGEDAIKYTRGPIMRILIAAIILGLSTSAFGVECADFRHDIADLDRAGKRAFIWREALVNAEVAGERIHEGHPTYITHQKYMGAYVRAFERLKDHVTDVLVDIDETNAAALMSAVAELEAGRERAREIEESAPFPEPAGFRLRLENGMRFMEALFAAACD